MCQCATGESGDPQPSPGPFAFTWNDEDNSLAAKRFFQECFARPDWLPGGKASLQLREIRNRTDEHIHVSEIVGMMAESLISTGRFKLTDQDAENTDTDYSLVIQLSRRIDQSEGQKFKEYRAFFEVLGKDNTIVCSSTLMRKKTQPASGSHW